MNDLDRLPRDLWPRVEAAAHRLLMLDYDGTLAPLHLDRMDAVLPERTAAALRALSARPDTPLVVISGRRMTELLRLTPGLALTRIAEHGWETRESDGTDRVAPLPAASGEALARAEAVARAHGLGERLEPKRTGLVLHLRDLPPAPAAKIAEEARVLWREPMSAGWLRLDPIHGGLELRAKARDKGVAAREQIEHAPAGSLPVYLGDDVTDEDAFRIVGDFGIGIRVGSDEAATAAVGRLPSVAAVSTFLEHWLRVTGELSQPAGS